MAQQLPNYVKFLRGTPKAYEQLIDKDVDTLYFISDKDADSGKLYLGSKLIGGGTADLTSVSINDLSDVNLPDNIENNASLVYDSTTGTWTAKVVSSGGSLIGVMVGATSELDGDSGLVPVPKAGENILFLQGDGTWADPIPQDLKTLLGEDGGLSAREIAQDVINGWALDNPTDTTGINVRLTAVENTLNNLSNNYVTINKYSTEVGDLTQLLHNVSESSTLVEEINDINERLAWQEMNEQ